MGVIGRISEYREGYGSLVKLGLPVLVTQLGIIVVSFADTMMVGRYGTDQLAASAFVNSLFVVLTVMQIGFASGLTPLIGALFGSGRTHEAGRTLRGGLQMNLVLSFSFTVVMGILYFFLDRFGQKEELLPLIRGYYLIILCSLLPMAVFNTLQQTCNGITDTRTPMWFILIANLLNILGNYALIFGHWGLPELGLAGAGLSTLFSRVFAACGITVYFFTRRTYREYREGYRAAGEIREIRRKVWVTSYPVMIQSGVECFLWAFGAIVCGWYSKIQLAAYQVVNTIGQLGFMIYMSFSTATSILVANYIGRRDYAWVRRITLAGLHLILLLCTGASLLFFFFGHQLVYIFTPDEAVIASAMGILLPLVVYQYMDGIQLTYCNAIRGTSDVKPLLWISLLTYIGVGIPLLLLFANIFPVANQGIYWCFCIALGLAGVLLFRSFYRIVGRMEAQPPTETAQ
ncbi:MAG: MATE family efflux transporter [Muribaculaceae bacterium]|nr:MATE family efflux transporter [Muribaculaceae bacterium]